MRPSACHVLHVKWLFAAPEQQRSVVRCSPAQFDDAMMRRGTGCCSRMPDGLPLLCRWQSASARHGSACTACRGLRPAAQTQEKKPHCCPREHAANCSKRDCDCMQRKAAIKGRRCNCVCSGAGKVIVCTEAHSVQPRSTTSVQFPIGLGIFMGAKRPCWHM